MVLSVHAAISSHQPLSASPEQRLPSPSSGAAPSALPLSRAPICKKSLIALSHAGGSIARNTRCGVTVEAIGDIMAATGLISESEAWIDLKDHVAEINKTHLRELLTDTSRCEGMIKEHDGILIDFSRQRATQKTMEKLFSLSKEAKLEEKIKKMFIGEHINSTEDRAVLHVALRAPRTEHIFESGRDVVPDVWEVLDKIKDFSDRVRSGTWVGATGKPLTDVVAIGIGGSFLGPLFVHTALQTEPETAKAARNRKLRFLSNVDPIDVARALNGLKQETTLVVIVSKTFTTAETMLNARTVRSWITSALGSNAVSKHMVAVSTNVKLVKEFGIDPENAFAFWDWVGGRYSVCSAVGVLPLSLQYGFENITKFLEGAWSIDQHFRTAPFENNLPVLLGLLSVWNASFLGCPALAILPYCQALQKLAPHIQQVSMESNGKGVTIDGKVLDYEAGEIDFGEPGTNGQHSFYQLIHQGRVVPCDFIGIIKSQQSVFLRNEIVSNHDELMCNFFAQADALAYGKTPEELRAEGVPDYLIPHKTFTGNRPSLSMLLPTLKPYTVGQLLALYEHRIAVQGFIWGINSFDQWGVELGKVLASRVRTQMNASRTKGKPVQGFNHSTTTLLNRYLKGKTQLLYPEPQDVFPSNILVGPESPVALEDED
ncbi:glucose-6-phosphate isomerase, cytosolic [Selaginella moellendorffii]|uniref:glucose-6-phosphate isomerase, cytosolic n=1 Tax=Selaginella moellendorffii TaxID=88036 RepID=UPI000D1C5220|nr:glucose-6-phosphate isomerase, cytosolic [Selaginella moellendorffii]|eukprot:XP_024536787.1 glucose-6-phosphate isomerase, cytosolic [Selaginella moellendorffii]